MGDFIAVHFSPVTAEQSAMLIAALSAEGYDGFEEKSFEMTAFIAADSFSEDILAGLSARYTVTYILEEIKETNWNQVWESGFEPVVVGDFAGIRAHFHEPAEGVMYDIVITPQMSFGTGHHATTYMMVQCMRAIDFSDKTVFDFGTGTGVLAILAEKMGAALVAATDNDEWSISNAGDNLLRNNCSVIQLQLTGAVPADTMFDVILANINKNIILQHLPALQQQLKPGGTILFSGLLAEDEADLRKALLLYDGRVEGITEKQGWICIRFSR